MAAAKTIDLIKNIHTNLTTSLMNISMTTLFIYFQLRGLKLKEVFSFKSSKNRQPNTDHQSNPD